MKKLTKTQIESIKEIMKAGGAMASGDWTRGSGNYVNKRPIPPYFEEIYVYQAHRLRGFAKRAAAKLMKSRPRVQRMLVPSNVRSVNQILKGTTF